MKLVKARLLSLFIFGLLSLSAFGEDSIPPFSQSALESALRRDPATSFIASDFVTREEFERRMELAIQVAMESLVARHPDFSPREIGEMLERHGFLGPDSSTWEVQRLSQTFWVLPGIIQLFQNLEDPLGALGVLEHSARIRTNTVERLESTGNYLSNVVFGPLSRAVRYARALFIRHSTQIVGQFPETVGMFEAGQEYRASSARSLAWVHVTHAQMKFSAYEGAYIRSGRRRMSDREFDIFRDQYFQESRIMGLLFGVPPELLPGNYAEVEAFYSTFYRSGYLAHSPAAQEIERNARNQIERLRDSRWLRNHPAARAIISALRWFGDRWAARNLPVRDREVLTETRLPAEPTFLSELILSTYGKMGSWFFRNAPDVLLAHTDHGLAMARSLGRNPGFATAITNACKIALRKAGRHQPG